MADTTVSQAITPLRGLTEAEVQLRRERGQGNNVKLETSRSYWQIIRENVFTFINNILFIIGGMLLALGLWKDAVISVSVILINIVVNIVQEIRAKRKLDQISLLTRPKATALRDGDERVIQPTEIVVGDILLIGAGDQIVVDGRVVGDNMIEVDESQLTGESDLIKKRHGDPVFSGSFCVTGTTYYEVEKVGTDSLANRITAGAKSFRRVLTPLQTEVNLVIRLLVLLVAFFGILILINAFLYDTPLADNVRIAAVIAGLVPNGLFMMIALAYAMGAVRISSKGALVQQANAIESLSNVDVLCTDKTGTLTSNQIKMHTFHPIGVNEAELKRIVGIYACSTPGGNKTNEAIVAGCGGNILPIGEQIPFSSALKWSALAFDEADLRGIYVLGAPEMLTRYVKITPEMQELINEGAYQGLRVLLFAYNPQVSPLYDENEKPQLPDTIYPMGILWFSDVLRAEAKETLEAFSKGGIAVKVISGDNPNTVIALAKQAGLPANIKGISGSELEGKSEAELGQIAEEVTVFGRITPAQKEALVSALRSRGHYVAMIGDGVNDVLSLKKANLGIAMESGSQATRSVADVVLIGDTFASLPVAFQEGNRIRNGMQDILKLFLVRVLFVALLVICSSITVSIDFFPFTPTQSSIFVLLTVGIPVFGLALWAPSGTPQRGSLLKSLIHFIAPATIVLALASLAVFLGYTFIEAAFYGNANNIDLSSLPDEQVTKLVKKEIAPLAQSALVTFTMYCGLLLIVFAQPPLKIFVSGDKFSGDWRPTILAGVILLVYFGIVAVPPLRNIFDLQALPIVDYLIIAGCAALWGALMTFVWRWKIFDKFIGVNLGGPTKEDWQ